jgi:hypothetical protein
MSVNICTALSFTVISLWEKIWKKYFSNYQDITQANSCLGAGVFGADFI